MSAVLDWLASRVALDDEPTDAALAFEGLYRCPECREVLPRGIECEMCREEPDDG